MKISFKLGRKKTFKLNGENSNERFKRAMHICEHNKKKTNDFHPHANGFEFLHFMLDARGDFNIIVMPYI